MVKAVLFSVGLLLLLILSFLAIAISREQVSRPIRYELPPGYKGWVVVQFEDLSCPPPRTSGIYVEISISSSGRGCSPSPASKGWTYYRPEYVHSDGRRVRAPFRAISHNEEKKRDLIFIGTDEELNNSWATAPWR